VPADLDLNVWVHLANGVLVLVEFTFKGLEDESTSVVSSEGVASTNASSDQTSSSNTGSDQTSFSSGGQTSSVGGMGVCGGGGGWLNISLGSVSVGGGLDWDSLCNLGKVTVSVGVSVAVETFSGDTLVDDDWGSRDVLTVLSVEALSGKTSLLEDFFSEDSLRDDFLGKDLSFRKTLSELDVLFHD